MSSSEIIDNKIYDVVCIGFGPAGIALAVAMEDAKEEADGQLDISALFLEQAKDSGWHSNMLLPGTDIQHHFFRDFATPRNPRSRFTFANYLKEKGRIFSFGLLGGNPGRIEWNDYVMWAAEQVTYPRLYSHRVDAVSPVLNRKSTSVNIVKISAYDMSTGNRKEFYSKNVVVSTGRKPNIPDIFKPLLGDQVFHSTVFKSRINKLTYDVNYKFAVIGSGQNAIEIILYLADKFPNCEVYSINRNLGFRNYDLGHFSNEIYFPDFTDYYYPLPKAERERLFEYMKETNYSAVDFDVSRALYWKVYEEKIIGKERLHIIKCSEVDRVTQNGSQYRLQIRDIYYKTTQQVDVDYVILCTGFYEEDFPQILNPLRDYCYFDQQGDLIVSRDYEVKTKDNFAPSIYLNGLAEKTHGISDSASFSLMAVKAQRIFESLLTKISAVKKRKTFKESEMSSDGIF